VTLALLMPLLLSSQGALEAAVTKAMAGRTGAVVVMEVPSGRVVAAHRSDLARKRQARPGSTVKPFTLAALIEARGFDPGAPVPCERRLRIGSRVLDCTHLETGQAMRASDALAYSCNCYFARMARLLTGPQFASRLEPLGKVRVAESIDELRLQALGEENVLVTPLGLASAYRRLVMRLGGRLALQPVLEGLRSSVAYGTGRLAGVEGMDVAGKTGTARADAGVYTHGWFAGFAPAQRPEIVIVVFLERGQGGADAAPIAHQVLAAWQASRR
jgi:cell division protein FtsI/penicillin-binding protein 2